MPKNPRTITINERRREPDTTRSLNDFYELTASATEDQGRGTRAILLSESGTVRVVAGGREHPATQAASATLGAGNARITFTSRLRGAEGNSTRVAIVVSGTAPPGVSVAVAKAESGSLIRETITFTVPANQPAETIEASLRDDNLIGSDYDKARAAELVSVENASGSNGRGALASVAATALDGGSVAASVPVPLAGGVWHPMVIRQFVSATPGTVDVFGGFDLDDGYGNQ